MPIVRVCPTCKTRRPNGMPCPCKPPRRGSDSAARGAQRAFRHQLVAESDGQCAYRDADGERCPETENLQAAHYDGYATDGNFARGALLCPTHHVRLDHG